MLRLKRSAMSRLAFLLVFAALTTLLRDAASASNLRVDLVIGDDTNDGATQPVKTIGRAIRLAMPGDTIHLQPVTHRDWAGFFDKSGEPGKQRHRALILVVGIWLR